MILTVEIGNIHAIIGVYDRKKLVFKSRISTDTARTDDEYTILLRALLELYEVDISAITGGIIGSVVPQLVSTFSHAVQLVCGVEPLVVGPGIKTGLNIKIDQPGQLGANLVSVAVGVLDKYPAPSIVFDMGTATAVAALDQTGAFVGASIMPGISIMLNSLVEKTAQLPQISLEAPKSVIGTNTVEAMKSGIIFGAAAMLDGMAERYRQELGNELTIVVTGSIAEAIIPHCKNNMIYDKSLLLDGLCLIYEQNRRK